MKIWLSILAAAFLTTACDDDDDNNAPATDASVALDGSSLPVTDATVIHDSAVEPADAAVADAAVADAALDSTVGENDAGPEDAGVDGGAPQITCGNKMCEPTENSTTCPEDCPAGKVQPGGLCVCDSDCAGVGDYNGFCYDGLCALRPLEDSCTNGSSEQCPTGTVCKDSSCMVRCDATNFSCSGICTSDNVCYIYDDAFETHSENRCDQSCTSFCSDRESSCSELSDCLNACEEFYTYYGLYSRAEYNECLSTCRLTSASFEQDYDAYVACYDEKCRQQVNSYTCLQNDCLSQYTTCFNVVCGDYICAGNENKDNCYIDCAPAANNATCENAEALTFGSSTNGYNFNAGNTMEFTYGYDVFYRFSLSEPSRVSFKLSDASDPAFDSFMIILKGNCQDFVELDYNDDASADTRLSELKDIQLEAGDYLLVVAGVGVFGGDFSSFTLTSSVEPAGK